MAETKLSALTEATALTDADELYVNDGGTSKRITAANASGYFGAADLLGLDYGIPGVTWDGRTTVALVVDRLYVSPFLVTHPITITDACVRVSATGTATAARYGFYTADLEATSTGLVSDVGTFDVSSTGLKETTGLSVNLLPGLHLSAIVANGTVTMNHTWVTLPGLSVTSADQFKPVQSLYTAHTYGALPTTPGALTAIYNNNLTHYTHFKWSLT